LKNMKKYFCMPPEHRSVYELVGFMVDNGIGKFAPEDMPPEPWVFRDLEEALEAQGVKVTEKTLRNWTKRNNLPDLAGLRVLANFAGNTRAQREIWYDAFRQARHAEVVRAKESRTQESQSEMRVERESGDTPFRKPQKQFPMVKSGSAALVIVLLCSALMVPPIRAQNITFCLKEEFDMQSLSCISDQRLFSPKETKIYISFDLVNAKKGQKFTRMWYKDGVLFAEKASFNVDPWEGWTWLAMQEGLESGRYTLRVIVGGNVTAQSFVVEPRFEAPH